MRLFSLLFNMSENTFIKITNRDLWNKLQSIEQKIDGQKMQLGIQWVTLGLYGAALTFLYVRAF